MLPNCKTKVSLKIVKNQIRNTKKLALVDAHGHPVAAPAPVPAQGAAAGQLRIDVNNLEWHLEI